MEQCVNTMTGYVFHNVPRKTLFLTMKSELNVGRVDIGDFESLPSSK